MEGMTDTLWNIINEWRARGVAILDEEAERLRLFCIRKMSAAHIQNPEEYLPLLYADEVEWKLVVGKMLNGIACGEMEGIENVQ